MSCWVPKCYGINGSLINKNEKINKLTYNQDFSTNIETNGTQTSIGKEITRYTIDVKSSFAIF